LLLGLVPGRRALRRPARRHLRTGPTRTARRPWRGGPGADLAHPRPQNEPPPPLALTRRLPLGRGGAARRNSEPRRTSRRARTAFDGEPAGDAAGRRQRPAYPWPAHQGGEQAGRTERQLDGAWVFAWPSGSQGNHPKKRFTDLNPNAHRGRGLEDPKKEDAFHGGRSGPAGAGSGLLTVLEPAARGLIRTAPRGPQGIPRPTPRSNG